METDPEREGKKSLALSFNDCEPLLEKNIAMLEKTIARLEESTAATKAAYLTAAAEIASLEDLSELLKAILSNTAEAEQYEVNRVRLINTVGNLQRLKNKLKDWEKEIKAWETELENLKDILMESQAILRVVHRIKRTENTDNPEEAMIRVQAAKSMVSSSKDAAGGTGQAS